RLPTAVEWARRELTFAPIGRLTPNGEPSAHDALAEAAPRPGKAGLPWFLRGNGSAVHEAERELVRQVIPSGSTLAYTRSFEAGGRSWLLGTDGAIVPAERVRHFRRTAFHGVELSTKLELPLFWLRGHGADQYALERDGALKVRGRWAKLSAVALDPARGSVVRSRRRYLKTRETAANGAPLYVLEKDATVVSERVTPPVELGPSEKWLQFSVSKGTLVAYEGRRAVFVTLASPGQGDAAANGASTTPLGTFRISVKHLSDDMGPDVPVEGQPRIAEVPYAQYFDMPFAIHVAYWHESFGEPMSGGCINVAPFDGQRLFNWTTPSLPPGWDAVLSGGEHGQGTLVRVVP
ncbi:MAG TPA: L,D-transpeptidase, partial [Polyangiaceae bacterium]|nr:L,D-transpeptidase [Polyangiaceae bacterium]